MNSGRQPQQLLVIAAHSLPTGGGTPDEDRAPGEEEYEGEELEQGEGGDNDVQELDEDEQDVDPDDNDGQ